MSLTGEFKALDDLIKRFDKMASPEFRVKVAKNVGQAALSQIEESFVGQRDPWDKPWKPSVRAATTGGQTLSKSARLRRSMTSMSALTTTPDGFYVGTNTQYAAIHNRGGVIKPKTKKALKFSIGKRFVTVQKVIMPKRQFIPEDDLSPRWERAFEEAVQALLEVEES